ncbi:acyl-CoA thioesterase [Vibrio breoganii]|uniref:Acyl-CoA thioesterase n=1 Tax=Vibrio breoganii TaxID=553239 RepID=A0ABX1U8S4_9VIBR|nr:acyl-CoA thioesterase [Vibrio breoganii]NMO73489.1 acyl-CoA thioesterase [Vibrio breoganii]NMR70112.1 acyl-CoA thioesterase [Vibrio breoganii]PML89203.1 thioeseterase [Vibrio breoganii]
MYPFFRLAKVYWQARKQSSLKISDKTTTHFSCRPWDLDIFNELNNGRVLTLYDLGRTALGIRCGLMTVLANKRWALVVAGSSVRYRKRIHMFNKVTMHTQCVGFDDKWLYVEQSMWVKGQPCSSVLIRAGVTSKKGIVSPNEVLEAMGESNLFGALPLWVNEWVDSEQHRPWPPLDGEVEAEPQTEQA